MRILTLVLTSLILAVPSAAEPRAAHPFDVLVRVNGPIRVAANETMQSIVVISDNALIDGTVEGGVFVVNGRAEISGAVTGDVVVVGDVYLAPGARLARDVTVYGGAFVRAEGAQVDGRVHLESAPVLRMPEAGTIFLAVGILVLGATLLLTVIAWRPIVSSAEVVRARPFNVLVVGTLIALLAPLLAAAIVPTGVGAPLGLAILVCVIPVAMLFGFAVAAMAIGDFIAIRQPRLLPAQPHTRALAEVTIGVLVSLLVVIIPVLGVLILLAASTMGVGALVTLTWERWPRPIVPAL